MRNGRKGRPDFRSLAERPVARLQVAVKARATDGHCQRGKPRPLSQACLAAPAQELTHSSFLFMTNIVVADTLLAHVSARRSSRSLSVAEGTSVLGTNDCTVTQSRTFHAARISDRVRAARHASPVTSRQEPGHKTPLSPSLLLRAGHFSHRPRAFRMQTSSRSMKPARACGMKCLL